jgi:hypothetical protein
VDDDSVRRRPEVRCTPDRRLTALSGLLALGCVLASLSTDAAGRLLLTAAALVFAGNCASDLVFSPRLRADSDGVTVRSPMQRAQLRWDQIEAVRADVHTRHGLRSVALEVDAGERLIVLSRRAVGGDPERVAALVNAFDPRRR